MRNKVAKKLRGIAYNIDPSTVDFPPENVVKKRNRRYWLYRQLKKDYIRHRDNPHLLDVDIEQEDGKR